MTKVILNMVQGFLIGIGAGALIMMITGYRSPEAAYDAGVKDALSNNLHPIVHIEDGDTTITYKLQWPE